MSEYQDYLSELRSEVEKKAKRANQRLRQLEMSGITESSRAYQVTAKNVYDGLPGYVQTSAGNIAFDRSFKDKSIQELEKELENLDKFLEAKTSKVRGYKKQLEKSYKGYLQSQGELDEERTEAKGGKPIAKKGGTTFKQWQQLFGSEGGKHFGYQTVRALQKVPGSTAEIVEKEMNKAIAEEQKTGRALGRKNLAERVRKAGAKGKSKGKSQKRRK